MVVSILNLPRRIHRAHRSTPLRTPARGITMPVRSFSSFTDPFALCRLVAILNLTLSPHLFL
jgi:hypothetical protein